MAKVKVNRFPYDKANGGHKVIINKDGNDKITTGCCCCYAEFRSITATLSLIGYEPFTCEGEEPSGLPETPNDIELYLKYSATGIGKLDVPNNSFASINKQIDQTWEINPFDQTTKYTGVDDPQFVTRSPCQDISSCSKTIKTYECIDEICDTEENISWTAKVENRYTAQNLHENLDTMLDRVWNDVFDEIPAGVGGNIINAGNDSKIAWVGCAATTATFETSFDSQNNSYSASKTKLFIKFIYDTDYTLTYSNQASTTHNATAGDEIIIDPPTEPNEWAGIIITNKAKAAFIDSEKIQTDEGKTQTWEKPICSNFYQRYYAPDGKIYPIRKTIVTQTESSVMSSSKTTDDGCGGGSVISSSENSDWTFNQEKIEKCNSSVDDSNETFSNTYQTSTNTADWNCYEPPPDGIGNQHVSDYEYQQSISIEENAAKISGTWSGTREYNEEWSSVFTKLWPSQEDPVTDGETTSTTTAISRVTSSYDTRQDADVRYNGNCYPYEWNETIQTATTTINFVGNVNRNVVVDGTSITITETETATKTTTEVFTTENSTRTITYTKSRVETITFEDDPDIEWETEGQQNNITSCAAFYEDPNQKTESDVDSEFVLKFKAKQSESGINYVNYWHYYTIKEITDKFGFVSKEIELVNDKWVENVQGGARLFEADIKDITIPTPSEQAVECVFNVQYLVQEKQWSW